MITVQTELLQEMAWQMKRTGRKADEMGQTLTFFRQVQEKVRNHNAWIYIIFIFLLRSFNLRPIEYGCKINKGSEIQKRSVPGKEIIMEEQRKNVDNMDNEVEEIVEDIKKLVKKGNIARIVIKKGGDTILNLPLNAGIVGGIIGAVAAPWGLVASAVATIGFDCKIELVKTDGEVIDISGKTIGRKAVDMGNAVAEGIRETWQEKTSDVAVDDEVSEEELR